MTNMLEALSREPLAPSIERLGRLPRVTLGEQVYLELRDMLISGSLLPGEKLPIRRVAESLGVSIMPVREALVRLAAEDAIEILPNRAVRVPAMCLGRYRELIKVRLAVEGFAVEEAAKQCSASMLQEIRNWDATFRHEVKKRKPDALLALKANKNFHLAVYRSAELPTLVTIIEGLWLRVGPVINLDLRSSTNRLTSSGAESHHARLLGAIERRDPVEARAALTADIKGSVEYIEATGRLAT